MIIVAILVNENGIWGIVPLVACTVFKRIKRNVRTKE